MNINKRLFQILDQKGIKSTELAGYLNIRKSVISNWKTRGTNPPSELIVPICEFLKIDVIFFLTGKNNPNLSLPFKEDYFIKNYLSLSAEEKLYFKDIMHAFLKLDAFKSPNSKTETFNSPQEIREINYYYRTASAGTGQIIFDAPPSKTIAIPNIPSYKNVNYAIGVNGDSMEPLYYDGDTVLVEITDQIYDNTIGIFYVNGECYIKLYKDHKLISANKKYPDIPLTEDSRCLGKVIDVLHWFFCFFSQ